MEHKELDLSNVNQIDMECDFCDDDEGFGNITFKSEPEETVTSGNDSREIEKKTGIILDFNDDDVNISETNVPVEIIQHKSHIAQFDEEPVKEISQEDYFNGNFKGYNAIDMECSIGEDDDDNTVLGAGTATRKTNILDFGDEDIEPQLVTEEIVKESKKEADRQISQGEVEDDYYEKLKKKHASTNIKGAHTVHFHFAGDPKAEMDDFNDMNTPVGPIANMETATQANVEAAGLGESKEINNYRKLFEDLLVITGFELGDCGNGKCCLKDKYSNQPDRECSTINDVESFLAPYVEDCFIIPLQVETGENLKTCKDWVNWYTPEMKNKYPQCEHDIKYCDLCANHLPECKLF